MDRLIALQQRIDRELSSIIELRYSDIKKHTLLPSRSEGVQWLSAQDGSVIRREIDFLRDAGMVEITGAGMHLTRGGRYCERAP